ncbi:putative FmdB family regulatory protein [Sphaerotilus sulfidivorans]|uniref:FmdB family regulatory protein n=1 Tax=Sphaerotilus sulfidivorans TaxID=639200 RepID=A0A5C1Q715_9BURK|nr:FmdB family zinc ribbon protein [Sphaerotilus sulfidivorans]NZD47679.1 zinc ribbon domain-containing protein [Sphaerotilus sulfidivorans]QEN01952.1 zinc ribbon domain-containing protein [Sphaerotilus sulfidivorans]
MPIYAYRCSSCGHAKDVLQKMSDPVLTTCPACGAESFAKQVTAAGFQLKGSGWYVTDFRGGSGAATGATGGATAATAAAAAPAAAAADSGASTSSADSGSSASSASSTPCGGSCACH